MGLPARANSAANVNGEMLGSDEEKSSRAMVFRTMKWAPGNKEWDESDPKCEVDEGVAIAGYFPSGEKRADSS